MKLTKLMLCRSTRKRAFNVNTMVNDDFHWREAAAGMQLAKGMKAAALHFANQLPIGRVHDEKRRR